MTKTTVTLILVASSSLLAIAGCVSSGGPNISDYSTSCMFEVNPPGSYVWSSGDVEVKPGGGATAEGAAAMNDCIRRKAAAEGVQLTAADQSQTTEVQKSSGTVVREYTYGQPPVETAAAPAATERSCRNRNVMSGGTGYNQCMR